MQCCMNGVLINDVPTYLAPFSSEIMHAMQIVNCFNATHPTIIPSKLKGITSYFDVRKPTQEEYEDQNIFKIEFSVEVP